MKNAFSIFVLIALCSCKSKDCSVLNHKLIDEFEKEIKIVKKAKKGTKVFTVQYRHALIYLSVTTGIMTKAEYGDFPGYHNNTDCIHDIKVWENWLKEHSCLENEKAK